MIQYGRILDVEQSPSHDSNRWGVCYQSQVERKLRNGKRKCLEIGDVVGFDSTWAKIQHTFGISCDILDFPSSLLRVAKLLVRANCASTLKMSAQMFNVVI